MTAPTGRPAGLPPEDEAQFLRNLVKSSRQRPHLVKWTDRDGTERHTVLTQAEVVRLNAIAAARRIAKAEVLRQAAHVPVQPVKE